MSSLSALLSAELAALNVLTVTAALGRALLDGDAHRTAAGIFFFCGYFGGGIALWFPSTEFVFLINVALYGNPAPHWPEGGALWELTAAAVLEAVFIGCGGNLAQHFYLLMWVPSLSMGLSLHILAERVAASRSWKDLLPIVEMHQRLHAAWRVSEGFWGLDVTVFLGLMLGLVAMAAGRLAVGVVETINVPASLVVVSFTASLCVAGELQAQGGDALCAALAALPWDEWPAHDRRCLATLLAFAQRNSEPRVRYFGGMRLHTLVVFFNGIFKMTQLLRASFKD